MTLAQSKKLSQLTADNAQWEDRQLLRSGAVRGTEVQIDFEDEDERKVILLVHGMLKLHPIVLQYYTVMSLSLPLMLCSNTKPPFLDGRVVFTKQAEPVMPIKDPTSDMAIIARKGSALVREIHEKQSMNKSRQRFWELAGSKLGDILGVQKTAEQLGDKVGYAIRFEDVTGPNTIIKSLVIANLSSGMVTVLWYGSG
ncbi:hypothetical protein BHM03_00028667 [Ensete ventricosum]|nr:hypothetical protein BHM03_00028667 [Ensete ventricosum]